MQVLSEVSIVTVVYCSKKVTLESPQLILACKYCYFIFYILVCHLLTMKFQYYALLFSVSVTDSSAVAANSSGASEVLATAESPTTGAHRSTVSFATLL